MTENAAEKNINPLGTDDLKFVEHTAANAQGIADLKDLFTRLEFAEMARHRSKQAWLYQQGDVQFIGNAQPHALTGLSRAMTAPCGKIPIPVNESRDDRSLIAEYLREYNGEGIQHIALSTDNIYQTVKGLRGHL